MNSPSERHFEVDGEEEEEFKTDYYDDNLAHAIEHKSEEVESNEWRRRWSASERARRALERERDSLSMRLNQMKQKIRRLETAPPPYEEEASTIHARRRLEEEELAYEWSRREQELRDAYEDELDHARVTINKLSFRAESEIQLLNSRVLELDQSLRREVQQSNQDRAEFEGILRANQVERNARRAELNAVKSANRKRERVWMKLVGAQKEALETMREERDVAAALADRLQTELMRKKSKGKAKRMEALIQSDKELRFLQASKELTSAFDRITT